MDCFAEDGHDPIWNSAAGERGRGSENKIPRSNFQELRCLLVGTGLTAIANRLPTPVLLWGALGLDIDSDRTRIKARCIVPKTRYL